MHESSGAMADTREGEEMDSRDCSKARCGAVG
jgi:hypothetical protein